MRPSEVTLNFGTPHDSPRTSSDFEEIPYPHHWSSSQGQPEELPLHYMSEETARRRVHQHSEQKPTGYADYAVDPVEQDDGGKDVYAKMRQNHGGLGGGRPRRLPPPPPTSVVRPSASAIASLFRRSSQHILTYSPVASASSSLRISKTYLQSSTPFSRAGPASAVSASQTTSSGMRRTLASSGPTTSSASSTLMCIRRWGRCLLGSRGCCLGMTAVLSSRVGRSTLKMFRTSPCGS
jgi:hypothetical protein